MGYIMNEIEQNIKLFKRVSNIRDIDWHRVSIKMLLQESFIHDYRDYLDWNAICRYQKLSLPFIINHDNYVNWYYIVKKYDLPDVMIKHYYDKFDSKTKQLIEEE